MAKGHRSQIKRERNANKDQRPRASVTYVSIPVTKAKIVLDTIKGKDVALASAILAATPREGARVISKVLDSAVANAQYAASERDMDIDTNKLFVEEAFANQGPTLKRIRPRSQGRADRILKNYYSESEIRRRLMGQKVNPHGLRVGVIQDWDTKWYADSKQFGDLLVEDRKIRNFLKEKLYQAGISKIEIERAAGRIKVIVYTAKPGIIIGKDAVGVKMLKDELQTMTESKVSLNIVEVRRPERDAQLVAENIAQQLENRVSFRRAMKQSISRAMKAGAKGVKATVGGRVGGAEIARDESYNEGVLPLQTLRANIDYGFAEAHTAYGKLGVKVWINHGEVLPVKAKKEGSDN